MYPDIKTALTPMEADALRALSTGKTVLEVGALLGFSTVVMAEVAEAVVSVDPHDGYPTANPRPTWEPFHENLLRFGVADKVTVVRDIFPSQAATLALEDEGPPQFAFIDADGTYETTSAILAPLLDGRMAASAKFIAVHDYDLPEWPGAGEAVRDCVTQAGLKFGTVDTLAIIRLHPEDWYVRLDQMPNHPDD
jgi:hypothetical protein